MKVALGGDSDRVNFLLDGVPSSLHVATSFFNQGELRCPEHLSSDALEDWQPFYKPLAEEVDDVISKFNVQAGPACCSAEGCGKELVCLQQLHPDDLEPSSLLVSIDNYSVCSFGFAAGVLDGLILSQAPWIRISDFDLSNGDQEGDLEILDIKVVLCAYPVDDNHAQKLVQRAEEEIIMALSGGSDMDSTDSFTTGKDKEETIPVPSRLTVSSKGQTMHMRVLVEEEDLEKVKALDDLAFGGHQGIPLDYLKEITHNGAVVCIDHPDGSGKMVGEAQIILKALPGAEESVVRSLAPDAAYFEGFGVHPDLQGHGIGQAILDGVSQIAQGQGKTHMLCSVRPENAASIAAQLRAGFVIREWHPQYYPGENGEGARIVNRLDFGRTISPLPSFREVMSPDDLHSLAETGETVGVLVRSGDEVDQRSRSLIEPLLERFGYVGTHIKAVDPDSFILIFQPG